MKKKFLIVIATMMIFGLAAAAYAFQGGRADTGNKVVSSPMKDKHGTAPKADMSKVVVAGGDSCCKPGADCCKGGSCCHKKKG